MKRIIADYTRAKSTIEILEGCHREFLDDIAEAQVIFSETIGYLGFEEGISIILSKVQETAPAAVTFPVGLEIELHPNQGRPFIRTPLYLSNAPIPGYPGRVISATNQFEPLYHFSSVPELTFTFVPEIVFIFDGLTASFHCELNDTLSVSNRYGSCPRATIQLPQSLSLRSGDVLNINLMLHTDGTLEVAHRWNAGGCARSK